MLKLDGIAKQYGGQTVLYPIDLSVEAGRVYAIIGPSGCGKSTLLRLAIGLVRPDEGTVVFEDETMEGGAVLRLRHRMGYVIQEGGLFPHLTAAGNVSLMANYLGWEDERIEARLKELAELTHLPVEMLEKYPAQLSGGQRQRVSLMRALMLDPDLLLLDEPLGALDPLIRADLQKDLREIFQTLGKAVLMVTHDMGEAAYFADEIVLLRAGKVVQRGTIDELMNEPADPFVVDFINAQRSPLDTVSEAAQ